MQAHPSAAGGADIFPLESFPYQVTLAARFGDLAPGGTIEHIGMARNYEDARGALMMHLATQADVPFRRLHSFLVRATNERWASVRYPGEITFGTAVIALGGSSCTMELAAFQDGVCVGRSHAMAVMIGEDGAPAQLTDELRAVWMGGFAQRPLWRAPARPGPERRESRRYAHHLRLPTRFSDSDAQGHLNNIAHVRYCDEGRAAVLLAAGQGELAPPSLGTVEQVDISYLQEAQLFHPLSIGSSIRALAGEDVLLEQALFQGDACVAVCDTRVRLPREAAERLAPLPSSVPGHYS